MRSGVRRLNGAAQNDDPTYLYFGGVEPDPVFELPADPVGIGAVLLVMGAACVPACEGTVVPLPPITPVCPPG
jgi:hypothetical protein